ncbi:UNVERIFIED_ORG: DUF982 domain-containing protein [Roseateles sp. XES5]|nr:DUF982 domain-containing protein [Roseateles sp. XES5]
MDTGRWTEPVTYETATLGQYRTIASTAEAARILLEDWPLSSGKNLRRAKTACIAVLAGQQDPETARAAFLKAAQEADIFVRP